MANKAEKEHKFQLHYFAYHWGVEDLNKIYCSINSSDAIRSYL